MAYFWFLKPIINAVKMSASSHPNGTYPPASRANSTYVTDSKADLVSMELSEAGNRVNIISVTPKLIVYFLKKSTWHHVSWDLSVMLIRGNWKYFLLTILIRVEINWSQIWVDTLGTMGVKSRVFFGWEKEKTKIIQRSASL